MNDTDSNELFFNENGVTLTRTALITPDQTFEFRKINSIRVVRADARDIPAAGRELLHLTGTFIAVVVTVAGKDEIAFYTQDAALVARFQAAMGKAVAGNRNVTKVR